MLTEKELSPLNSIKKEAGTGSYQGMRWRIEKDGDDQMKVTIYPRNRSRLPARRRSRRRPYSFR